MRNKRPEKGGEDGGKVRGALQRLAAERRRRFVAERRKQAEEQGQAEGKAASPRRASAAEVSSYEGKMSPQRQKTDVTGVAASPAAELREQAGAQKSSEAPSPSEPP